MVGVPVLDGFKLTLERCPNLRRKSCCGRSAHHLQWLRQRKCVSSLCPVSLSEVLALHRPNHLRELAS